MGDRPDRRMVPRGTAGPTRRAVPAEHAPEMQQPMMPADAWAPPGFEPGPDAAPHPTDAFTPGAVRREELGRTSIQSSGTRYPALAASAALLIRSGALMFWTCLILAAAAFVLTWLLVVSLGFTNLLAGLAAVCVAAPVAITGRVLQLWSAVSGELLVVTMDVEESLRRIAASKNG